MPFPSESKPWSFYRLGPTKEKELFKRHRDSYQGVVIPAHIASYYSKFCTEFIGTLRKPYFIDPLTYVFSYDSSFIKRFVKDKNTGKTKKDRFGNKRKGDIKRSYLKLVENEYCEKIQQVVDEDRSLIPDDLSDSKVMEQFVEKVVQFQLSKLSSIPEKYKKYKKYARDKLSISDNPPMCIVAPYFPTTTLGTLGWHSTNIMLINRTKKNAGSIPVFAVVLANVKIFAQHAQQIASDYLKAGVDGFLFWPDGFSSDQDIAVLQNVFNSVRIFSETGKPVILMYGDAFSLALYYAGLSGFSCGICYGEAKDSIKDVDVEGGIPPRYYVKKLKKKMRIEPTVQRIQNVHPELLHCDCATCKRKPDPLTLDDLESREHFMLTRATELNELRNDLNQKQFAQDLRGAYEEYRNDPLVQPDHLRKWADVLEET